MGAMKAARRNARPPEGGRPRRDPTRRGRTRNREGESVPGGQLRGFRRMKDGAARKMRDAGEEGLRPQGESQKRTSRLTPGAEQVFSAEIFSSLPSDGGEDITEETRACAQP